MSNNKQSVKLYTEEQVKQMIDDAHNGIDGYYDIFKKHTPIEIPSDEEIHKSSPHQISDSNNSWDIGFHNGWKQGAKWMRDKIQGGNNEQQ